MKDLAAAIIIIFFTIWIDACSYEGKTLAKIVNIFKTQQQKGN